MSAHGNCVREQYGLIIRVVVARRKQLQLTKHQEETQERSPCFWGFVYFVCFKENCCFLYNESPANVSNL